MRFLKRILISIVVFGLTFLVTNTVFSKFENDARVELFGEDHDRKNKSQKIDDELFFLLVGVDKNANGDEDFTRTDTIMLIKANVSSGRIDLFSIPRDTRVLINDEYTKINHAHAYGGIDLTIQTIRNFLGVDLDYYVQVDFDGLKKIVDSLGGVDYDIPSGMYIQRGESVDIKPGPMHLNGLNTLWVLRTRSIYQSGDIGRVKAQQQFLKSVLDQVISKVSAKDIPSVVNTYLSNVKTNIPLNVLLGFSKDLKKFSSKNMHTYMVKGYEENIGGTSYYIADYDSVMNLRDMLFNDYKIKNWTKEKSGYGDYEQDVESNFGTNNNNYNDYNNYELEQSPNYNDNYIENNYNQGNDYNDHIEKPVNPPTQEPPAEDQQPPVQGDNHDTENRTNELDPYKLGPGGGN